MNDSSINTQFTQPCNNTIYYLKFQLFAPFTFGSEGSHVARLFLQTMSKSFGTPRPIPLSPIGCIKILTYLILGFLGATIFDCIIRSCDLFYWFIRTCLGPTVVPAAITSLELFCVLTMCYFCDNVSSKENIKILWLIFMFYCSDIITIKNSYWFFSLT